MYSGTREWTIETTFLTFKEENQRLIRNMHTRLLKPAKDGSQVSSKSFILNEGDVLYLPPRIPHRGVTIASGNEEYAITISMGFRSLNYRTLLTAYIDHITNSKFDPNKQPTFAYKSLFDEDKDQFYEDKDNILLDRDYMRKENKGN